MLASIDAVCFTGLHWYKNVCCLWQVGRIFLLLLYLAIIWSSASYATFFTVGCLEHYKNWVAWSRYILIFWHCILRLL